MQKKTSSRRRAVVAAVVAFLTAAGAMLAGAAPASADTVATYNYSTCSLLHTHHIASNGTVDSGVGTATFIVHYTISTNANGAAIVSPGVHPPASYGGWEIVGRNNSTSVSGHNWIWLYEVEYLRRNAANNGWDRIAYTHANDYLGDGVNPFNFIYHPSLASPNDKGWDFDKESYGGHARYRLAPVSVTNNQDGWFPEQQQIDPEGYEFARYVGAQQSPMLSFRGEYIGEDGQAYSYICNVPMPAVL